MNEGRRDGRKINRNGKERGNEKKGRKGKEHSNRTGGKRRKEAEKLMAEIDTKVDILEMGK